MRPIVRRKLVGTESFAQWGIDNPTEQVLVRCTILRDTLIIDQLYTIVDFDNKLDSQYTPMSSAPDDILNGIASLAMVDKAEIIEGVGVKVLDTTYWVVVDKNMRPVPEEK